MRIVPSSRTAAMRMILPLLALGLGGAVTPASASDRIFADGFETCCTLGGEVSGLTGNGLVLNLAAGATSEDKPVSADGGGLRLYTFANTAPPGTAYTVIITTQPSSQTCTLINASGSMASAPVDDINVACVAGPADLNWDEGAWSDANWQ